MCRHISPSSTTFVWHVNSESTVFFAIVADNSKCSFPKSFCQRYYYPSRMRKLITILKRPDYCYVNNIFLRPFLCSLRVEILLLIYTAEEFPGSAACVRRVFFKLISRNSDDFEHEREEREREKRRAERDWLTSHVKQLFFQVAADEVWGFYSVLAQFKCLSKEAKCHLVLAVTEVKFLVPGYSFCNARWPWHKTLVIRVAKARQLQYPTGALHLSLQNPHLSLR